MNIKEQFGDWYPLLEDYLNSKEFNEIGKFLNERIKSFDNKVYPEKKDIFCAFRECPLDNLKVIMLGNHPYCSNQANGLAYGIKDINDKTSSNYAIENHIEGAVYNGLNLMFDNSLVETANQGVLWLNTQLTIETGDVSHKLIWQGFMSYLFSKLADTKVCIIYVFMEPETKYFADVINPHKVHFAIDPEKAVNYGDNFNKINNMLIEVAKGLDVNPKDYIIKW